MTEVIHKFDCPKVVRDGKVAVLYSGDFGGGWSSANYGQFDDCIFDPDIVALVEAKASPEKIKEVALAKWDYCFAGDTRHLRIKWVPVGGQFRITDYDGRESVIVRGEIPEHWLEA